MAPRLGIVAGAGALPGHLVAACRRSGRDFHVLAFERCADAAPLEGAPVEWIRLGAFGRAIAEARRLDLRELVLAGGIPRPSLAELMRDPRSVRFLARVGTRILGDDQLLTAVIRELEEREGFRIVGADEILGELLATAGNHGAVEPDRDSEADIVRGFEVARAVGEHDIGQAVVVQNGTVLGVEGVEGTDGLIRRCAPFVRADTPGGVLVKRCKPGQERRADLPAVGVDTVRQAAEAGLRGIAVEAGGAIIIDSAAVIAEADRRGVFLHGIGRGRGSGDRGILVWIIAGEPSGDMLGARLMAALSDRTGGRIRFAGVGGDEMAAQGLSSLFPISEIAVMGMVEVLPRVPRIRRRVRQTARRILRERPDAVVSVDSPGFCHQVWKRVAGHGIPLIHYVAPTVWAWKPGRARAFAALLDHLMVLLPFEPRYFEKRGLACTFVGHPAVEGPDGGVDGPGFRAAHGIPSDATVICVLPGSRQGEVAQLLPVFRDVAARLGRTRPGAVFCFPTPAGLAGQLTGRLADWPGRTVVVTSAGDRRDAMAASDVAVAASGTVSLELARMGVPHVVAYRMNRVTVALFHMLRRSRLRYVNLVNILLDRGVIPEFLQGNCREDRIAAAVAELLDSGSARAGQVSAARQALDMLRPETGAPSSVAAATVLGLLERAGGRPAAQGMENGEGA